MVLEMNTNDVLKSLLHGEKFVPEPLASFIMEKWFLPDVNIRIMGDLDGGSYTIEATVKSWKRRFVVENHQVTEDNGPLGTSRTTGNVVLDLLLAEAGPDVKIVYSGTSGKVDRVRVSKDADYVNLENITGISYTVGAFMVSTDKYLWSLIFGGTWEGRR